MADKIWFVTGTDTEVGKTRISCALLKLAAQRGKQVAGYKPVASGSELTAEGWRNTDGLQLQAAMNVKLPYEMINPITLSTATSPHIAARAQGISISLDTLSSGLRAIEATADWLLVEGAGGWRTPLTDQTTLADWVQREKLPIILVVGMRLGCINHAVLTAEAIRHDGLTLVGWVANLIQPAGEWHQAYTATLQSLLSVPLLAEMPYGEEQLLLSAEAEWLFT